MFTPLTISGLVVGLVLILAGTVLIVLSYTTKLFYTQTKISTAAGASIADGRTIVDNADVAWDETGIVLDSTGIFVKWTSTKLYSDTDGGAAYSYGIVKASDDSVIATQKSKTGLTGIFLDPRAVNNFLTNRRTSTQTWASFPRYQNDSTVVFAFSCPIAPSFAENVSGLFFTQAGGMSFWHSNDGQSTYCGHRYNTYIDTDSGLSYNQMSLPGSSVYSSLPLENIQTYTTASYGTLTSNVSAFSYTSSSNVYMTYFNGRPQPLVQPITPQIPPLTIAAEQPKIFVGPTRQGSYSGTIYALYVFGRVLSDAEVSSVSTYLQQKYFTQTTQDKNGVVPPNITLSSNSVSVNVGDPVSSPIPVNTGGPITGFSITPELSDPGLKFNAATGVISGIPTTVINTTFTITAGNDGGFANATFKLQVYGKEFKNKYAYIGAGGAAVAAGAALVGTACFYGLDWKSSRIQVPPADISSNAPA